MTQLNTREDILTLGAKVGAMIQDGEKRTELAETIAAKGDVKVYADTADTVHLVVPSSVDAAKIGDEAYLEELGRRALGSCVYHIQPD
ncbi:hypothetical protein DYI23_05660 [Roseibium polysiphoniae]|uniref:Uncharacterized protein n=1 Tax=Roseibium polysiphoniae TaxID=2571221 RepID=A0A944CC14_9HYPH|nr:MULTISPECIES: hypothetical protein [Stappiaceae]MBS8259699.1 hypothetical protein [Roseibium polysiphoniae]